jgi:hypothetical protein
LYEEPKKFSWVDVDEDRWCLSSCPPDAGNEMEDIIAGAEGKRRSKR